ncbi:hypothetical protein GCM10023091_05550 [Ravibacter arvi]|uniref:Uncharacterized protein n=1 Tax=Ravibacter arvi TaxID=2051041 RepID=A0ABP8LQW6_9BACT
MGGIYREQRNKTLDDQSYFNELVTSGIMSLKDPLIKNIGKNDRPGQTGLSWYLPGFCPVPANRNLQQTD